VEAIIKNWVQACASDELGESTNWPVRVEGRDICLYRVQGIAYATEDRCSHGSAKLSDGLVDGHEIECPYHLGRFDIRTGAPTLAPCVAPVKTFPVEEREGVIWMQIEC
jgi:nitrite reductase/ring-hydroxylating ferredoxin subunit